MKKKYIVVVGDDYDDDCSYRDFSNFNFKYKSWDKSVIAWLDGVPNYKDVL